MQFGDIVLDCTASTRKDFLLKNLINLFSFFFHSFFLTFSWIKYRSFYPRLSKGWSPFCGLGGGLDDFKNILEPLIVASFPEVFKKQQLDAQDTSEILGDEEFPESSIVARHRFSK